MRERLVAAFAGLTIIVVALYGVPRAYVVADLVRDQEQERLDRTAELVAAAVGERLAAGAAGSPVDSAYLDGIAADDEVVRLETTDGAVVGTSDWSDPAGDDIAAEADVPGGGTVTVARDGDAVGDAVARALLPLVLLGLVLAVLAGVAGYLIARRIARPFQDLAEAARGLGAGRLTVDLPAYRVPEAQEIAAALAASGRKLDALLRHERELTAHASHELRTPVTALRLELEDLALWPQTAPEVADQLRRSVGELDRLEHAIGDLLATSKGLSAAEEIDLDLDALVADTVARSARRVVHDSCGALPTRIAPAPVVAALEQLLPAAERVRTADRGTHLEVVVSGAGVAVPPSDGEVADLVAAVGGQVSGAPDGVLLRLPRRPLAGPPG